MEPFGLNRPPLKKPWRTISWASRKIPTAKTTIKSNPTIPNRGSLRSAGPGLFESLVITTESPPPKTAHQLQLFNRDLGNRNGKSWAIYNLPSEAKDPALASCMCPFINCRAHFN